MELTKVLEIEKKFHLNSLEINGCHYWTMFRFSILQTLHGAADGTGKTHHIAPEGLAVKLKSAGSRWINLLNPKHYHISKSELLFVSGGRRVLSSNGYENTIADPLMRCYENSLLLEYSLGGIHLQPACSKHLLYHDRIGLAAAASGAFHRLFRKKAYESVLETIRSCVEPALDEMCEAMDISANTDPYMKKMADFCYQYGTYRRKYGKLLDRVDPKAVIMVVSYDSPKMILTELAKERGIPVIELQHGTAGREHPGYNYPAGEAICEFPDYYLTFSDFWRKQARFPIPEDHRIAVGSPFSERRAAELKSGDRKADRKTVLFLSQPERGEVFSKLAAAFCNLVDPQVYRVVFKMHPTEQQGWRKRYTELAVSSAEVVDNSNSDLYELMSRADFIVAVGNTTALYEALLFDAPVFVFYKESMAEFREMADTGLVGRFDSEAELRELICNADPNRVKRASFWETDSLNKMKAAVDGIAYK